MYANEQGSERFDYTLQDKAMVSFNRGALRKITLGNGSWESNFFIGDSKLRKQVWVVGILLDFLIKKIYFKLSKILFSPKKDLCFQCSHCNKKFATNNLLKEHVRKHSKI